MLDSRGMVEPRGCDSFFHVCDLYMRKSDSLLVYTFRTFPFKESLRKEVGSFFIFGSLKKDFEVLKELIIKHRPAVVLGLARALGKWSHFESVAVNRFNRSGKISATGAGLIPLTIPAHLGGKLRIARKPSASFCNWSAYKLAEFNPGSTRLMFAHVREQDLATVIQSAKCELELRSTDGIY